MVLQQQQQTLFVTKTEQELSLKTDQEPSHEFIFRSKLPDISIPNHLSLTDYVFQKFSGDGNGDSTATCLIDGANGRIFTYGDVQISLRRIAAGIHGLGIRQRDTIMLLLPNSPEFALCFLAVAYLGAVSTTANPFYTEPEIEKQAKASATKMIITKPCYVDKLTNLKNDGVLIVCVDDENDAVADGCVSFKELTQADETELPKPEISPEDTVAMPYSSGTTGLPKGVMITHKGLVTSIAQKVDGENPNVNFTGDDVILCFLPMFHIYALDALMLSAMRTGAAILVVPRFELNLVMELIQRYKVTVLPVAPPVVLAFVKSPETERYDLSSVRIMLSGAATLKKELEDAVRLKFPNAIFGQMASSSSKNQQTEEPMDVQFEDQEYHGNSADANGASSQASKVKKVVVPRSVVWKNYSRTTESRDKCICHHCQKIFSCASKSGTSNLKKHLKICKEHQAWLTSQKKNQQQIGNEGNLKASKVPEPLFREACNELVVLAELPLSFIESTAFKHFCQKVNLFKPHSRRTLTRNIVEMFVKKKAALKNLLITSKQRVSLTTDIWVSQVTGASYMVITAHFIDDQWQLRKLIIGFKYVVDHKGQTIANVLLECLADWGLERVFCITVDNATANTSAIKRFHSFFSSISPDALVLDGNYLHMRCAAHIINLIAKEGLSDLSENVLAIRNAVQYVRSSTSRLNAFDQRVTTGKMTRGSLPLDIKTRWNSTFLMLSRALQFKVAFDRMEAEDRLYNDYFLEVDNGVKRCGPPASWDWKAVEKLIRFLVIFYNSTLVVSASSKVNAYKCYGEIVTIERNLIGLASSLDSELQLKASEMLKKFLKYWDGMKGVNKMLILATIFDPTQKMHFAKLCFEKLYGKDSLEAKEMAESVIDLLTCMFKEYSMRFKASTGQASQPIEASDVPGPDSQEQAMDRMELVVEDFGYERMDVVYKELVAEKGEDTRDELEVYLKEAVETPKLLLGTEFDILSWWKMHKLKYPVLAEMARDLLAMQVSSVASESAFSTSGRILEPYRSCLTHYMIEVLMCSEQWLHADIKLKETIITNEQILADVEELDKLEKEFEAHNLED